MLHPLESFVKKSNHPRPPNPPPASMLLKFLGWGACSELPGNKSISPQAPRAHWAIPEQNHSLPCFPLALTSPKPRPQPLTPSRPSWPPPAPRRANSLPSGKLLPLSQGAPSPPGASEALPLGPALLSHPSPPSPAASLPWGVEGSRDLWNFQGRRGWRPPSAQRHKSRARGRPVCACDLRAQG